MILGSPLDDTGQAGLVERSVSRWKAAAAYFFASAEGFLLGIAQLRDGFGRECGVETRCSPITAPSPLVIVVSVNSPAALVVPTAARGSSAHEMSPGCRRRPAVVKDHSCDPFHRRPRASAAGRTGHSQEQIGKNEARDGRAMRAALLEIADKLAIAAASESLVRIPRDGLDDEPHRSIAKYELRSVGME